jgi:SOS-response transcriptional repressor LexA
VDGEATVKTYRAKRSGIVLEPANATFEPITITPPQELVLLGKVVAVLRKIV